MGLNNLEMKQKNFSEDKKRVDRFEPEIKRILGEIFIETAPETIDKNEATDLLILEIKPFRIGCRVRRYEYYINQEYKYQFTIRNERPSKNKSELQKIMRGDIDYSFYGFADEVDENIISYVVCDLKILREVFWFKETKEKVVGGRKNNKDNSSDFYWFDWRTFPEGFIKKTYIRAW